MTEKVSHYKLIPPWEERDTYYYLPYENQKKGMEQLGGKYITGGKHAALLGFLGSDEQQKVLDYMLHGKKIKVHDEKAAQIGLDSEPILFDWYNKTIESIDHCGPAVSKKYPWLLCIADARTKSGKGVVEFKTRKYINENIRKGRMPLKDYIQVQGEIKSYDVEWCDYIVYSWKTGEIIYMRIFPDDKYWDGMIVPSSIDLISSKFKNHRLNDYAKTVHA
jgi:hypothetical protein